MTQLTIDKRTVCTLLAALRFYQSYLDGAQFPGDIYDIATEAETIDPLSKDEIDALCEDLNTLPLSLTRSAPEPTTPRPPAPIPGVPISAIELQHLSPDEDTACPKLEDIPIFEIRDRDSDETLGYSFDHAPQHSQNALLHVQTDPDDPGADLTLYAFNNPAQAAAFAAGIALCSPDHIDTVIKVFAPTLTLVLVHFLTTGASGLSIVTDYHQATEANSAPR